jgi:hypothetical protein
MKDYSQKRMSYKPISYTVTVANLKQAMVNIHLNHLHSIQLDMIDEAVLKSDMTEAKTVIKHIMELPNA